MEKKFFSQKNLLILIFLLGFFLRFYKLGEIPQVLTRDEAAIGYNAYSILKTGKDEYGVKFPLWFLSFGDYKNPLYIYLTALVIPVFGLTEFSVRFLSALSGSLTILVVYYLVCNILKGTPLRPVPYGTRATEGQAEIIALLTTFLLTISPWHIFYSRMAYEATLALFFVGSGVFYLLRAKEKGIYFLPSLIFFILSFFTYNPPLFILPILIPISIFLFRKEYLKKFKSFTIIFLIIFYGGLFLYFLLSKNLIKGRAEATIFSKNYFENKMALMKINQIKEPFNLKFFLRKKPFIFYKFFGNYFSVFKTEFLFLKGDGHLWHGISLTGEMIGNQYLITLPFFLLGLFFLFKERKKEHLFILFWFFLNPVACSFTQDAPNTTRLHDFLFLYLLISSLGFYFSYLKLKKLKSLFLLAVFLIFFLNIINYLKIYFRDYPKRLCNKEFSSMWLCGVKEVISYVRKNENKYQQIFIVTSDENEEPYIQFAFYLRVDPFYFQKNAKREKTQFITVKELNNYYFEQLPINVKISDIREIEKIKNRFSRPKSLFIARETDNLLHNVKLEEIKRINDSEDNLLWLYLKN